MCPIHVKWIQAPSPFEVNAVSVEGEVLVFCYQTIAARATIDRNASPTHIYDVAIHFDFSLRSRRYSLTIAGSISMAVSITSFL